VARGAASGVLRGNYWAWGVLGWGGGGALRALNLAAAVGQRVLASLWAPGVLSLNHRQLARAEMSLESLERRGARNCYLLLFCKFLLSIVKDERVVFSIYG
jgi:hypothetical protein